jgi:hypothetical protein
MRLRLFSVGAGNAAPSIINRWPKRELSGRMPVANRGAEIQQRAKRAT